tara:strand:+ start:1872 stop:2384 length:513 start_codon:yes stop_codon:yes gene_type:complete
LSEKIIGEVKDYINKVIRPPRDEFGGMPTCPFAGPELDSGRLMIDIVIPGEVSLPDLIQKFLDSGKRSALFAQLCDEELTTEETKQYQIFINRLLRKVGAKDYKCICFNPNDKDTEVDGFNPRAHAPYFLINIASKDELHKAHKTLKKSKYYDRLDNTYRKFLKMKPKKT